ncbi:MAG TPA: hypothetical protein VEG30_10285 [Terriglobales bacterium]|nr:hypothetical protein [Terriglobales bacterium]
MSIRVADEAWIATALLHKENPGAEDFGLDEIYERAMKEFHDRRPGVRQHIVSHAVASNPPDPAQIRMLHISGRGRRRLFRPGDPVHPQRSGKVYPEKRDIPEIYHPLVDWYLKEYAQEGTQKKGSTDPKMWLQFVGLISAYDLRKMAEAIESGTEQIDPREW